MNPFRTFLQQEFLRRSSKNSGYSLRAFAQQLSVNHATMSGWLSGKRKISENTVLKLGSALGLGPRDLDRFVGDQIQRPSVSRYQPLAEDVFVAISEWYFDAILELSQIPGFKMTAEKVAEALSLPELKAKLALETLQRLGLLQRSKYGRFMLTYRDTTNDLDPELTSSAKRRHQQAILEKSVEAVQKIERSRRDHTSTTMAFAAKDLAKAREIIRRFRAELNAFAQKSRPDQVYQLQVSFFPLTQLKDQE